MASADRDISLGSSISTNHQFAIDIDATRSSRIQLALSGLANNQLRTTRCQKTRTHGDLSLRRAVTTHNDLSIAPGAAAVDLQCSVASRANNDFSSGWRGKNKRRFRGNCSRQIHCGIGVLLRSDQDLRTEQIGVDVNQRDISIMAAEFDCRRNRIGSSQEATLERERVVAETQLLDCLRTEVDRVSSRSQIEGRGVVHTGYLAGLPVVGSSKVAGGRCLPENLVRHQRRGGLQQNERA